jgi:hypothetical protein
MAVEALPRHLTVGLVPQPSQPQPAPIDRDVVQRIFTDIGRDYPYQQMAFTPDGGAQFMTSLEDLALVQPMLLQVRTPIMAAAGAREKAERILRVMAERLAIRDFLVFGFKIVAHVALEGPRPDARAFVSERLLRMGEQADELGPGFFGAGIKYRRIDEQNGREDVLLIEPFVGNNEFLFIDYDVQRRAPFHGVENLSGWIDDGFTFVRDRTMAILEAAANG